MASGPSVDGAAIARRLAGVRARIAGAGADPATVTIVAVTKGFDASAIVAAVAAGCDHVGESYAQEALPKLAALGAHVPAVTPTVHFIGQVQRNKVRALAPVVHRWDTLDRLALVDELARRAPGARVLVQVDTTGTSGKGGCPVPGVPALVEAATAAGLAVEGLMTVGPTQGGPGAARAGFAMVRRMVDRMGLSACSMGMSHDLEVAVAEGATEVRVGSALFGERPAPPAARPAARPAGGVDVPDHRLG